MRGLHRNLVAIAGLLLLAPGLGRAQGPGSGDELPSDKPSPQMLRRIWQFSKARQAQERRIKELKAKIAVLRAAVPKLQSEAMREADSHRIAQDRFAAGRRRFKEKWEKILRIFGGKSPLPSFSDTYGSFGVRSIYSADVDDWTRSLSRQNQSDGDDFYIYCTMDVPQSMVGKEDYGVDFAIRGFDYAGQEKTFYYSYGGWRDYQRLKWKSFRFRRRLSGLGLTPGWYEVAVTLKIKGKYWLRRTAYDAFRVTQVNPLVSAPPAVKYRRTDAAKVSLTSVSIQSRGAAKDLFNPKSFYVKGRFKVDSALTGSGKQVIVGADVYGTDAAGRTGGDPWRAVFRHRLPATRSQGYFGSDSTTRVKDDIGRGLRPGRYALRVWVLVPGTAWSDYWAYEDRYFVVAPATPGRR